MSFIESVSKVTVGAYAYTPYQLLIMSSLAVAFREKYPSSRIILIRHTMLETTSSYFNMDIWDCVIPYDGSHIEPINFFGFYRTWRLHKWYRNVKEQLDLVNKVLKKLPALNFFLFSSGDSILIPAIKKQCPQGIFINVGEGSVSYNRNYGTIYEGGKWRETKWLCKVFLFLLIRLWFGVALPYDAFHRTIDGGKHVHVFADVRPELATETFRRNRILLRLSWKDISARYKKLLDPSVWSLIPDPLKKGGAVLFLTTRLSEDGFISLEEEINFYQKVIHEFSTKGYQVFIKPHPRESVQKLSGLSAQAVVLDQLHSIPLEILFQLIQVRYYVDITSSSEWNAYEMKIAKKFIILNNLYYNVVDQIKPLIKYHGDNAGGIPEGENIFRPISWCELSECIDENR